MIYSYYLFILLAVVVLLMCAACVFGLRMRRQRAAASATAEQRYSQFVGQNNSSGNPNNNEALYAQGGAYGNMYYQQQQQPPQVGVVNDPGTGGFYYPNGGMGTAGANNGRPVSATVLYAAPANGGGAGVDFGNYFPEAQVAGGYPNNANNTAGTGGPSQSQAESSPYGEADYVSRPPQPLGVASVPPPQYRAGAAGASTSNIVGSGNNNKPKGKELD